MFVFKQGTFDYDVFMKFLKFPFRSTYNQKYQEKFKQSDSLIWVEKYYSTCGLSNMINSPQLVISGLKYFLRVCYPFSDKFLLYLFRWFFLCFVRQKTSKAYLYVVVLFHQKLINRTLFSR